MHRLRLLETLLVVVCSIAWAMPAHTTELDVGDPAPGFALQGSDGEVHRLSDHHGQAVVLAWFPKAFTGG